MSHDTTARRVFNATLETIVRRILKTFDAATKSDVESGVRWYMTAHALAEVMATDPDSLVESVEQGAALIAALSPRTDWTRNVAGAVNMAQGREASGCIGSNIERAQRVLDTPSDPYGALGNGPKVAAFARNIAGDVESVTVDVWACRVADLDETLLSRKGAYDAVAHAYRLAARRRGVDPATMQATTWIVARGGRAS